MAFMMRAERNRHRKATFHLGWGPAAAGAADAAKGACPRGRRVFEIVPTLGHSRDDEGDTEGGDTVGGTHGGHIAPTQIRSNRVRLAAPDPSAISLHRWRAVGWLALGVDGRRRGGVCGVCRERRGRQWRVEWRRGGEGRRWRGHHHAAPHHQRGLCGGRGCSGRRRKQVRVRERGREGGMDGEAGAHGRWTRPCLQTAHMAI